MDSLAKLATLLRFHDLIVPPARAIGQRPVSLAGENPRARYTQILKCHLREGSF